jgi:hypothetical protein
MSIIYLISIVAIIKLLQYFYNRTKVPTKETITYSSSHEQKIDLKSSIEKPKEFGKNKFLYPDDEFISHKKVKKYKPKNYDINFF